jgi:hypothetical protein
MNTFKQMHVGVVVLAFLVCLHARPAAAWHTLETYQDLDFDDVTTYLTALGFDSWGDEGACGGGHFYETLAEVFTPAGFPAGYYSSGFVSGMMASISAPLSEGTFTVSGGINTSCPCGGAPSGGSGGNFQSTNVVSVYQNTSPGSGVYRPTQGTLSHMTCTYQEVNCNAGEYIHDAGFFLEIPWIGAACITRWKMGASFPAGPNDRVRGASATCSF